MNISNAQLEFQIRRYLWAKSKAAEEIREEFPHFWLFKGGASWKYYQFMRRLERDELELFACALLKRWHRDAAAALGETTSIEEKAIEDRFSKYNLKLTDIEREIAVRRRRREKVQFASKRKVQNGMIASFKKAFGGQGSEVMEIQGYSSPLFWMRYSGWIVQTGFYFGRTRSLISYHHLIASEERICHPATPGVTAPALLLANALCWIGLGRMEWDYLMNEDIEPACHSVVTLCREFFDELPRLLRGLEREKITTVAAPAPIDCSGLS